MPLGKRRAIYQERLEQGVEPTFAGRLLPFYLEFAARFGAAASNAMVFLQFSRDVMDAALERSDVLQDLVYLLNNAPVFA